jgi:hypothetical protein
VVSFILNNLLFSVFNLINSRIDAYKIKVLHKEIRHGINFIAYGVVVAGAMCLRSYSILAIVLNCLSAFFNRQITFDIPLNLRRGLSWDYQSTANPPKAIWDRIEKFVFRSLSGKQIVIIYLVSWVVVTVLCMILVKD